MTEPTRSRPGLIVIRASSLPSWNDCQLRMAVHSMPWAFAAHGFELNSARANIGALMGSGLHGGGEAGLFEKMKGGTPPFSLLENAAVEEFHRRRKEEANHTVEMVYSEEAPDIGTGEWQVRRMTRALYVDVVELAEPIAVESRLEAVFRKGDGSEERPTIVLSGKADLLHIDRTAQWGDAIRVLRDTKSSRRKRPPAIFLSQIGAYSMLFRTEGFEVDRSQIDAVPVVKTNKEQPPVEQQPLDVLSAEKIANHILGEASTKAEGFVKDGDPYRYTANPSSFLCNQKFCRAHGCSVCWATRK